MIDDLSEGDRVRVDIPDEGDPDHEYHGTHGEIVKIVQDDAGRATGDPRDSVIYRVKVAPNESVDLRWRDVRPPID
jgi:hypothetical protein